MSLCVDGDDDDTTMAKWCEQLTKLGADTSVEQLMPGPPQDWVLAERRLLNPESPGGEAWAIALTPKNPAHLHWTAGDIAEIWPRNSEAAVEEFLIRHQLDGALSFKWRGNWTFLRDIIAHSRLPKPHEVEGISVQWLVERLEGFGAREYSIASLPDSGRMELLVRKAVKDDGSLGLGSGWLTETSDSGRGHQAAAAAQSQFPPARDGPADSDRRRHRLCRLARASAAPAEEETGRCLAAVWRARRASDLYYGDDLVAWQDDGTLARTDLVFSRDEGPRKYVQHLVADAGGDIASWVGRGASILVCGGLAMAAGVQEALVAILGEEKLEQMTQSGLYRRDIY